MPDIIWNYCVILSVRNVTTELCVLKVKRVVSLNFDVTLGPTLGIDNDKYLGGTPEERIILKCTLTFIFEDLIYAGYAV